MPLRRGFWRELLMRLKEGTVLTAKDLPEILDISHAAQAILISTIESRLMSSFTRPLPRRGEEFYAAFSSAYMEGIRAEELRIWEELGDEIDHALSEQSGRDLTGVEAAYLSYTMLGIEEPPQSYELYINLAAFARAYEELMRKKYGEKFSQPLFYKALREHMPAFLVRLISMDSVISVLLTMNVKPRDQVEESIILQPETTFDACFMEVRDDDSFSFRPKFVEAICSHAKQYDIREDQLGRTEDRGCPVLYASERDSIIRFSIEELITQHEMYEHKT